MPLTRVSCLWSFFTLTWGLIFLVCKQASTTFAQEVASECVGSDEFLVVNQLANFDAAVVRCTNFSGVLGVTFNQQEFDKVVELGSHFDRTIYMGILKLLILSTNEMIFL